MSQLRAQLREQGYTVRKDIPAVSAFSIKSASLAASQTKPASNVSHAQLSAAADAELDTSISDHGTRPAPPFSSRAASTHGTAAAAEPVRRAPSSTISPKEIALMQAQLSQLRSLKGVKEAYPDAQMYPALQDDAAPGGRQLSQTITCGAQDLALPASQPRDTFAASQLPPPELQPYGLSYVQADGPAVIAASRKLSSNVLFCIIDSGLNTSHPDLSGHLLSGSGSCNGSSCSDWRRDTMGHGTHVAGTLAALRNGQGVIGVSGNRANLHIYNIFGTAATFPESDFIVGWESCLKRLEAVKASLGNPNVKAVVSMSIGGPSGGSPLVQSYLERLYRRGDVLLVAAAGNNGGTELFYPASYGPVISVSAVGGGYKVAAFSQHNAAVELAAPGGMCPGVRLHCVLRSQLAS
jgi:subtilisin family serine protease